MKTLLSIIIAIIFFSCHKKSEDPQPALVQNPPVEQTAKTEPYYRRIVSEFHECCPSNNNGISQYEKFVGHDDSHTPKADLYRVTMVHFVPSQNINDTLSVQNVRIWWKDGKPESDLFAFKYDTSWKDWFRTWKTQENMNGNTWLKYEVK